MGPSLGWVVISWIEHFLIHGPGDVQGDPVLLDDEFAGFIEAAYELHPKNHQRAGRRRYRRAFLSRSKGRAKSELAGMLVCVESLGPVRFAGWARGGERTDWGYVYSRGEPMGRPVTYPFIRCLATEEGQAGNTFGNVAYMLHPDTCSERLADRYGQIDAGRDWQTSTRIYLPGGGEVRPSTASNAAKDGGKESFAVADETHLYVLPELRGMHATVARNLQKRKTAEPWMLETSTMYAPGQDSIAERTHEAHKRRPDGSVLFDHRQASRGLEECGTVADVVACLREAYDEFAENMDLEATAEDILDGNVEDPERYFFNRPTHRSDDWCRVEKWNGGKVGDEVDHDDGVKRGPRPPKGMRIVVGFDGSFGTSDKRIPDSTVLRGKVLEEGDWFGYRFTVGVWEADSEEWEPPFEDVDAAVDEVFDTYDVWRMYPDPAYWRDWISGWQARFGEDRVVAWPTNRDRQMADALEALHGEIHTDAATLLHDGDPRVANHYANARRHVKKARGDDPDGKKELVLVKKETPRSANKIDAVVTDALAGAAFRDGLAAGAHKKKRRSRAWGM